MAAPGRRHPRRFCGSARAHRTDAKGGMAGRLKLGQLLVEKGVITREEFAARLRKLSRAND